MDITESLAANSQQQNADEYLAGPKTVTVSEVKKGSAEQPVDVHLVEFPGKPFKPAKSVRRVLAAAWGTDASQWAGRRLTIYCDPDVKYAGKAVGGLRVSHVSHIDKPVTVALTVTRGKREPFTVQPLPDAPAPAPYAPSQDFLALMADATTPDEKNSVWQQATEDGADQAYMARLKEAGSS
jgi:hypothetical protein